MYGRVYMITKIIVVGDTHVGSIYGLASPEDIPENRNNAFLEWIFDSWKHFCNKHKDPDYLITIGDLADGSQIKNLGIDALATDTDEQVKMTQKLLMMLIPKGVTKIYGVNGSGYHGGEGQGTCIDRRIIESIGGEYKGTIFEFEIKNERMQVSHGGAASLVNPSTYIQREISLSKSDAQKRKVKGSTIILRGHQHRFYTIQDDSGIYGVLNGCWQYITPFMSKKSANVTPSFGALIIEINDVTKIYRAEYLLPEEVRQAMNGYEKLTEQRKKEMLEMQKLQKIENDRIYKETLRGQKY
jgi:hypothetical protein